MSGHSWCRDIPRDEAVRASEDGRQGLLPTLEEAIAEPFADSQGTCETGEGESRLRTERVTERRPVDAGGGGNVTGGLRTERVKLEITHFGPESVAGWEWKYHIRPRHIFESVRVVEEAHFDDLAQVAMERDAAIRERDTLRAERITQALTADRFAAAVAEADTLRARVEELESAPAASGAAGTGWLTGDERLAVSGATLILDQHGPTNIGRTLNDLLARSSPPEVVMPVSCVAQDSRWQRFVDDMNESRDRSWLAALAAAGVTVKEVG